MNDSTDLRDSLQNEEGKDIPMPEAVQPEVVQTETTQAEMAQPEATEPEETAKPEGMSAIIPVKTRNIAAGAVLAAVVIIALLVGGNPTAAAMSLFKTEGTVGVSDEDGKAVSLRENLRLYSGYGVGTEAVSFAWINLDKVKLAKLDEDSEIEIQKNGKELEILLNSGSIFFNVAEPLKDDESMTIRTSSMIVGIRGTCGWVELLEDGSTQVFILEGEVEAESVASGQKEQVAAGEMAEITIDQNGNEEITVLPFAEEYIAPFVMEELEEDEKLCAAILDASGLNPKDPPDPEERLMEEYERIIAEHTILDSGATKGTSYTMDGITYADEGVAHALLVDLDEDGTEELILISRKSWDHLIIRPITRMEVYGMPMGQPVLYGETTPDEWYYEEYSSDELYAPNAWDLLTVNGQRYIGLRHSFQIGANHNAFALENRKLILASSGDEDYGFEWNQWKYYEGYEELELPIPDEIRMKNAFIDAFEYRLSYDSIDNPVFAKRIDLEEDGKMLLYAISKDGEFLEHFWNGAELESTSLERGITYAKLIDMDQDGKEELLLVTGGWKNQNWDYNDCQFKVYSINPSERFLKLLDIDCNEVAENFPVYRLAFYRDSETGDIYIGIQHSWYGGVSEGSKFYSLTDSVDAIFDYTRPGAFITLEEQDEAEAWNERRAQEYEAKIKRFEQIEEIDQMIETEQGAWEILNPDKPPFDELKPTVEEVRQYLRER